MTKFFTAKDIDFIKTISEEVVDYVVEQAVTLFKISVGETTTNLYGESLGKVWRAPSTMMAIVDREPMNIVYEGFGADRQGAVEFRFNRERLRETSYAVPKVRNVNGTLVPTEAIQNLTAGYPEIGDVMLFDGIYYEIDNVKEPQWIGGSPEVYNKEANTFESTSNQLIVVGFMARKSQIQIDERTI